jgi:hypothetical protein
METPIAGLQRRVAGHGADFLAEGASWVGLVGKILDDLPITKTS